MASSPLARAHHVLVALCVAAAPASAAVFKLAVEDPGIYRVDFEELAEAGLDRPTPSATLGLSSGGHPAPVWVQDGGDGTFGPGDALEFLGRRLPGESSYHNEFSRFNVYLLDTEAVAPERRVAAQPTACGPRGLTGRLHLEEDSLRVRFRPLLTARPEIWFWARLGHADREPFGVDLELDDLDEDSNLPVRLRIHLKGWSSVPYKGEDVVTDHEIELRVGGRVRGSGAWSNSEGGFVLGEVELAVADLVAAGGRLELRVPRRRTEDGVVVDVSLLNWIEVAYPRRSEVTSSFAEVLPPPGAAVSCVSPVEPAVVLTRAGRRIRVAAGDAVGIPGGSDGEPVGWLALGDPRRVVHVERDLPSRLATPERRADYIMIAHPTLVEATRDLARFHRGRGLAVEVVDVTDVYDEFRHGIVHPGAIRDFLAYAYAHWREPKPRFVLLVGDASWDLSDEPADDANYANMSFELATAFGIQGRRSPGDHRFSRQEVRAYDEAAPAMWRNLIPTWDQRTSDGPAASDNWFADVEGEDLRPEMAIGRLPVAWPAEVRAIVEKTVATARRMESESAGSGRNLDALLVTDHYRASMTHADTIAGGLEASGFAVRKIYPTSAAVDPTHLGSLVSAFDASPDLVYFVGHGGRYEWRTGRPDLAERTDLFTLDHIDRLAEQHDDPLPIVLSIACYSAPFDHPSADSIGEKLLRVPGRGAAAVVAAAWRITPSVGTGSALVEAFGRHATVGEALLAVKSTTRDFQFVLQFNLLGDPALPVAWSAVRDLDGGRGEGGEKERR